MLQPRAPRSDEVGGPHHRRRQRVHDRCLQAGDGLEPRMLARRAPEGPRRPARPCAACRRRRPPCRAAPLIPSSSPQSRLRQHSRDGLPQRIVIDRLHQPARKPRRQLLERHDLQPVPPPPRRLEPQFPHPEQAVGDYRVSNNCFCAHDASPGRSETELI